jgi:hypothetical protein
MFKSFLILAVFILITASIGRTDKEQITNATKTFCKDICK